MKILKLECWIHAMRIGEPYTIAYETISKAENVFLRAETNTGITAWGCAAPDLEITGESAEMVMSNFTHIIEPILRNSDPFRYGFLLEKIKKKTPNQHATHALADTMLFDLMARQAREPLYKLLGGFRKSIPSSITIGILPLRDTLKMAERMLKEGFRILKLKGGLDVEDDIERVKQVRKIAGKKIKIRFDANQGYTVDQAVHFIFETKEVDIEILEQPTNKHSEDLLGKVTHRIHVPVMADESLMTLRDAFRLTRKDLIDMINIKLMKMGGINEAMHINSVAKSAGVEVMVGCMDESALGIAAGLHFALSRPNVIYADLDGHLDLIDDPFHGLIKIRNGVLSPIDGHGLGTIKI